MHSVLLSSVHLRCASSELSRWEKDWSSVSHRVKVSMDLRISSKMFDLEKCWKAKKALRSNKPALLCDFIL